jgi:hypothetical protein
LKINLPNSEILKGNIFSGCQHSTNMVTLRRFVLANEKPLAFLFLFLCMVLPMIHEVSQSSLKDRYGEPERGAGSEWEPIKILLEVDGNSNKMNADSNTLLQLTTQVGQAHVASGVPLDLGTNTQPSDPRTQRNTKPRVYRPTPVRQVSTTGQTGPCW